MAISDKELDRKIKETKRNMAKQLCDYCSPANGVINAHETEARLALCLIALELFSQDQKKQKKKEKKRHWTLSSETTTGGEIDAK